MSNYSYLNASEMRTHFSGDEEMIGELVEIFEETYLEILQEVEKTFQESDALGLEHSAHTLKGMVANFFADSLKEDAFELEKMGRDKQIDKSSIDKIENLKIGIPELLAEVRKEFNLTE